MHIEAALFDYVETDKERIALEAIQKHGTCKAASEALGNEQTYCSAKLNQVRRRAARQGYAPEASNITGLAPSGFRVKKISARYDADGAPAGGWTQYEPDGEAAREALETAIAALAADIPREPAVAHPGAVLADLCTLYTFTDYHVGMLAWHKENLEGDWDTQIAEKTGNAAMDYLVSAAPASQHGIVNIQGDFLHWDGLTAITPQHGHVLDADGRFGKVVDVAIRLIRSLVFKALSKHEKVTLLICEGNHDLASSLWLRKLFAALYENEPRITVHDSEMPYYAIQHGDVMLGFHHGHLRKNEQLPALFAAQFREMWGQCKRSYIHTGHRHHKETKDHPGARVIQHPTLAARDAHASRGGWFSDREITAITYSKKAWAGDINWTPEMMA